MAVKLGPIFSVCLSVLFVFSQVIGWEEWGTGTSRTAPNKLQPLLRLQSSRWFTSPTLRSPFLAVGFGSAQSDSSESHWFIKDAVYFLSLFFSAYIHHSSSAGSFNGSSSSAGQPLINGYSPHRLVLAAIFIVYYYGEWKLYVKVFKVVLNPGENTFYIVERS